MDSSVTSDSRDTLDILIVEEDGAENITGFPFGPEHMIVGSG